MAKTSLSIGKNSNDELTVIVACGECSAVTETPLMSLISGDRVTCVGCKGTFLIDDNITNAKSQIAGLQDKVKSIANSLWRKD